VQVQNAIAGGLEGDLDRFFSSTLQHAKSVGQAFTDLGLSISSTFSKALNDRYLKPQLDKLLDGIFGKGKGAGGQLAQSSTQMIVAGQTIGAGAATLAQAAQQLQTAAETLANALGVSPDTGEGITPNPGSSFGSFSSFGAGIPYFGAGMSLFSTLASLGASGPVGGLPALTEDAAGFGSSGAYFAGGGPVRGPGSSTSDSIPAYLSDGEYVTRASAVRHYGVGLFHSLNAMRFAEGGPVDLDAVRRGMAVPAVAGYTASVSHGHDVAARAAAPSGGDNVQRHVHEFPPELMHMTFAEGLERIIASQWARR
jgi:hypothetical protein